MPELVRAIHTWHEEDWGAYGPILARGRVSMCALIWRTR